MILEIEYKGSKIFGYIYEDDSLYLRELGKPFHFRVDGEIIKQAKQSNDFSELYRQIFDSYLVYDNTIANGIKQFVLNSKFDNSQTLFQNSGGYLNIKATKNGAEISIWGNVEDKMLGFSLDKSSLDLLISKLKEIKDG